MQPTHRVRTLPRAKADIAADVAWVARRSERAAERWANGLADAIESLDVMPGRFGVAREARAAGGDVRQMLCGKRQHKRRVLYEVFDDEVVVYRVIHGARDTLTPEQLRGDAADDTEPADDYDPPN